MTTREARRVRAGLALNDEGSPNAQMIESVIAADSSFFGLSSFLRAWSLGFRHLLRFITQIRRQTLFNLHNRCACAHGIVFHLVARDFSHSEIFRFRMREIK